MPNRMQLPSVALPAQLRIPALCLIASIVLHWLALEALLHAPKEFRVAVPAAGQSVGVRLHTADVSTAPVGPMAASPGAARSESGAGQADSPAVTPAPVDSAAAVRRGPEADAAGAGHVSSASRAAIPARPIEPPPSIASARSSSSSAPAASTRAAPAPARVPEAARFADARNEAPTLPDDRGIQSVEQYRIALLFEAGRLRAASPIAAIAGSGRSRLRLDFAAGGALQSTRVLASSGDAALDDAAAELLTRAHARLPVPATLTQRSFALEATVSFESR